MKRPYVLGLTGNIACGKSTVLNELQRLGAAVLDADAVVHRLLRRGTPVHAAVVAAFGPGILAADGEIDRRALGAIVFADAAALAHLEALVHPAVLAYTGAQYRLQGLTGHVLPPDPRRRQVHPFHPPHPHDLAGSTDGAHRPGRIPYGRLQPRDRGETRPDR